jgi:protein-L-isoaspartate O-methyltransferase
MPISEAEAAVHLAAVLDAHVGFGKPWRSAFAEVHRGDFLPAVALFSDREGLRTVDRAADPNAWLAAAYRPDVSVRIMDGNRIRSAASQPLAMAELLLAARAEPGMRVLEIGSGVGFMAALLAHALGPLNVTTVELDSVMAATAGENLAGHGPIQMVCADGLALDGVDGPFDRIISTCAVDHVPAAWLAACPRGRIVAPWITTYDASATAVLDTGGGSAVGRFLPGVAFMPASGMPREDDAVVAQPEAGQIRRSNTWLRCPQVTAKRKAGAALAIGVQLPGVRYATGRTDDGAIEVTLWDGDDSWARSSTPDAMDVVEFVVEQAGPRDLWDEVETAYRRWRSWSRPSADRFGLTADGEKVEYWLDYPDQVLSAL